MRPGASGRPLGLSPGQHLVRQELLRGGQLQGLPPAWVKGIVSRLGPEDCPGLSLNTVSKPFDSWSPRLLV